MFKRRELFPLASGLAGLAVLTESTEAQAASRDVKLDPYKMPAEMREKYSTRLATLDRQSAADFYGSFRLALGSKYQNLEEEVAETLTEKGIKADPNCSLMEAWDLCLKDPRFAMKARTWISGQQLMWSAIKDSLHTQRDQILAEMEKTDRMGPGKLELNPNMEVPEYTRYEIHIQPGGYVGDPLAGGISAFGSKHFGRASANLWNDHTERHLTFAQQMATPEDGNVNRILDMGTGFGYLASSLKVRFPDAEVWGIDVGGPQVRWAHNRCVKLGLDVNYAQRLAEDTKFPDGHFDIVTSYILHHEVTAAATKKIVAEAFRILRPGGVFRPIDFVTVGNPAYNPPKSLTQKAATWQDHRYNNEVWTLQWKMNSDLPQIMRDAGFAKVTAKAMGGAFGDVVAVKA